MRLRLTLPVLFLVACASSDPATPVTTTPNASTPTNDAGPTNDVPDAAVASIDPLSTDRAQFFGASRCAGLMFCEDFESGTIDATKWLVTTATKPVVDDTQHARGQKALHVVLPGSGGSYITTKAPFPAPMNRYWGRAFFRFGKLPTSPAMPYAHWTFAAASGTGIKGEIRLSGQLQGGRNLFGVGTDNRVEDAGTGDWTTSDNDPAKAPRPVPTDEWMCIEWLHAGDVNETHFYWDAVEHPSLATTPTKHGGTQTTPYVLPQFTQVWVGWAEYQTPAVPFEMWVDEVAFDSTRIGCVR